jgi:RNA polymerase sigma-70 factor (ECF subfamily)
MDSFSHVTNEKELLTLLRDGDEAAFTQIYNLYWKKCFFASAQKLQNLAEAEELVQDIFLDLWKRREELNVTTCLSAYLSGCIKYKVINLLAKKQLASKYVQHAITTGNLSDFSTEQDLRLHELKHQLLKETSRLPEKCRIVFQMSREEGFSQKQIAHQLNISEKTVESHLSKALRNLRTGLAHFITVL